MVEADVEGSTGKQKPAASVFRPRSKPMTSWVNPFNTHGHCCRIDQDQCGITPLLPRRSIHPMQPGDITEEQLRERVQKGEEVLFINALSGYGRVMLHQGELKFRTLEQQETSAKP